MSWIFLALLAPFFWTASNFIDKYLLGSQTRGIFDFLFLSAMLSGVIAPFLLPFFGLPILSMYSLLPLFTGMFLIYSYGFYGKGIAEGETSQLILLFQLLPVLTLLFGFLLLGQTISVIEFIAFVLVLVGALAVSVERIDGKMLLAKGAKWIFIAIIMWAGLFLMADFALTKMEFGTFFVLDTVGGFLAGFPLLLFSKARAEISEGLRFGTFNKYGWFSANVILDVFGQMSVKKALALAPAAGIVAVITQVQSLYGIIIGVLLTLLLPNIFRENISSRHVGKKVVGVLIMAVGIGLLFLAGG